MSSLSFTEAPLLKPPFSFKRTLTDCWGGAIFVASSLLILVLYLGLRVKQAVRRWVKGGSGGTADEEFDEGPLLESDVPIAAELESPVGRPAPGPAFPTRGQRVIYRPSRRRAMHT